MIIDTVRFNKKRTWSKCRRSVISHRNINLFGRSHIWMGTMLEKNGIFDTPLGEVVPFSKYTFPIFQHEVSHPGGFFEITQKQRC